MNALRTGAASRIMPAIVVAFGLIAGVPTTIAHSNDSRVCQRGCCHSDVPSQACCNSATDDSCPAMATCKVTVWTLPVELNRDLIPRGAGRIFGNRMVQSAESLLREVPLANLRSNSLIQLHVRLQI
jgi:hypothetical protein